MKIRGLMVLSIIMAIMAGSCGKNVINSSKIKSPTDSLSYAFGIVNYNALATDQLQLDPMLVAKAMIDGEKGEPLMTDEEARGFIMVYINQREQDNMEKQAEENKVLYKEYIEQNDEFLAQNKGKQGVNVTPSGLQYEVIKMGTGPKPGLESTVKVHYVGTLIDGTEFDSSIERNEPAEFPVSGVISGWSEALQLMPVGSKFKIVLPQELAYGANGAGDLIKPFSTLIFEVELLEIVQ
jgi:FKBP-type peptidyl-prolyl cis-trans isomerase FklB